MGFFDVLFTYCILTGQTVLIHHFAKVHQERFVMPRAGLTNVGALFGKMCGGPLPPYTVESRIESKMVHPFNMDKPPTTVFPISLDHFRLLTTSSLPTNIGVGTGGRGGGAGPPDFFVWGGPLAQYDRGPLIFEKCRHIFELKVTPYFQS